MDFSFLVDEYEKWTGSLYHYRLEEPSAPLQADTTNREQLSGNKIRTTRRF